MANRRMHRLIEKCHNKDYGNFKFDDADWLLGRHGYERRQPSGGSSHFTYDHPELEKILGDDYSGLTIPKDGKEIKKAYVKLMCKAIMEKIELLEE